jgi:hypothetical protein
MAGDGTRAVLDTNHHFDGACGAERAVQKDVFE